MWPSETSAAGLIKIYDDIKTIYEEAESKMHQNLVYGSGMSLMYSFYFLDIIN